MHSDDLEKQNKLRFRAIRDCFNNDNCTERYSDKDFTNNQVEFLIIHILDCYAKINTLERQLDPNGEHQKMMKIISEAAKHISKLPKTEKTNEQKT